jgi:hypothetical protein
MKTCPYCAEEIQAAAIVCHHCRRNVVPLRSRGAWRWARGMAIALGVWLVLAFAAFYFSDDQQQFRAFVAEREAWHRNCDSPFGPDGNAQGTQACADELRAMIAEATRHGWAR